MNLAPLIMRSMRIGLHKHRVNLSVVQFRALAYLDLHPGSSLSAVAEHVGLTLPTMSRMVNQHVAQKLVLRQESPTDRRRVTLALTPRGRSLLKKAHQIAQSCLMEALQSLPAEELAIVMQGCRTLLPLFTPGRGTENENSSSTAE